MTFGLIPLGGFDKLAEAYLLPPAKPKKKKKPVVEVEEAEKAASALLEQVYNQQRREMEYRLATGDFGGGWNPSR